MKKNIIFFVIDSLSYERLIEKNSCNAVPFFKKLMKENISFSNMYSQAPYTEAALMGLICGAPTMNHNGYMMRYRDVPETFLETFSKNGYDVYQVMQPHIYPSSLERNLPNSFYNVSFDFNALWSYRLEYYASLYDKSMLEEKDYGDLKDLLNENFKSWILFLERLRDKDETVSLIIDNLKEYNVQEVHEEVKNQYLEFTLQPILYINNLLQQKREHQLFKIPTLEQKNKIHKVGVKEAIIKRYTPFFQTLADIQRKCDVCIDEEVWSVLSNLIENFMHFPTMENVKKIFRFLKYVKTRRNPALVLERISEDYDAYKAAPSVQKHFDHFFDWVEKRSENDKPFLAYIHVDDIHNPEIFFSYDSDDLKMITEEFQDAQRYIQNLPKKYRCSVTYDLALQYMSNKLEKFIQKLKSKGILEDTVVYITADHGFSFYNHPLRESVPNNFYKESYHVPFIIINDELKPENITGFHSTMDIPATIISEAGLEIPPDFYGKNVFESERSYVTMEYMGGGCPDFYRRPIKYAIRNSVFSAVFSIMLTQEFDEGCLEQFFDLVNDPDEKYNLVFRKKMLPTNVSDLLDPIRERHKELRKYYHVC